MRKYILIQFFAFMVCVSCQLSLAHAAASNKAMVFAVDLQASMPNRDGWKKDYAAMIEEKLRQHHFEIARTLSPFECTEPSCMAKAMPPLQANLGIFARITNGAAPLDYVISMTAVVPNKPVQVSEENCLNCSEFQVGQKLKAMMENLFGDKEGKSASTSSGLSLNQADHSRSKKIAFYTLGGVGGALLVAGAVGLALSLKDHGNPACTTAVPLDLTCETRHDNTKAIAISAAGLGVGAIMTPLFFVLAAKTKTPSQLQLHSMTNAHGIILSGAF